MECALFDFGGTLVDVEAFLEKEGLEFDIKCFRKLGYNISKNRMKKAIKAANDAVHRNYIGNPYKYREHVFFLAIAEYLDIKISKKSASVFGMAFRERMIKGAKLFPDARKVLKKLKDGGYKLGIVSNADSYTPNKILERLNIAQFFDTIVISEDVGKDKIKLLPFKIALKKLKVAPEDAVMIGDRIDEDITAAAKLGIKTVLFDSKKYRNITYVAKVMKPDFRIKNLIEIEGILERCS